MQGWLCRTVSQRETGKCALLFSREHRDPTQTTRRSRQIAPRCYHGTAIKALDRKRDTRWKIVVVAVLTEASADPAFRRQLDALLDSRVTAPRDLPLLAEWRERPQPPQREAPTAEVLEIVQREPGRVLVRDTGRPHASP